MNTINRESLQLKLAPQIEGLHFRNFEGEQDFEHMVHIYNTGNIADGIKEATTVQNQAHYYAHKKKIDPYKDIFFAQVDDQVVAYASVFWEQEHEGPLVYFHAGHVLPEWRRKGLGTALFQHTEDRLREIASGHDAAKEKVFHGWLANTETGTRKLFEQRGYEEIRYFYLMIRDLNQPIPEVQLPDGLEVVPVKEEHFRKIFDASNEAFRDHWGHVEQTEEAFERWVKDPVRDESIWKVAWDGDEVAGMVLNYVFPEENQKLGVNWGWTDPICVRRPWRRRGLARALILESLHLLKQNGFDHAALGVDTKNPSGALTLYKSAGYEVREEWTDYRRKMD